MWRLILFRTCIKGSLTALGILTGGANVTSSSLTIAAFPSFESREAERLTACVDIEEIRREAGPNGEQEGSDRKDKLTV